MSTSAEKNVAKIVVIGHHNAGKTAIIRKYCYDDCTGNTVPSLGNCHHEKVTPLGFHVFPSIPLCYEALTSFATPQTLKSSEIQTIIAEFTTPPSFPPHITMGSLAPSASSELKLGLQIWDIAGQVCAQCACPDVFS
jgi:GTPase SAR1 family protein